MVGGIFNLISFLVDDYDTPVKKISYSNVPSTRRT